MNIIRSSEGLTNKDIYDFTISGDTVKMQDVRDIVVIDKYAIVEDDSNPEDEKTVLVVRDSRTGELYGTISPTFIKTFTSCLDIFGDEFKAFSVKNGVSKGGREFIDCKYEEV